jgi:dTDP-4-dehydrorhamnose 3,5-epimerase
MKIIGLKKIEQKIIKNRKGDIIKFLSKKSTFYRKFGEVYFSEIIKNKTKGWNYHRKNHCILCVPQGKVEFFFIDGRKESKTYFKENKITIGRNRPYIIKVPPRVWISFKSKEKRSLVVNFMERPHSKNEALKSDLVKNYLIK